MTLWLKNIFHPERFHGEGRKPPFFEGWYFKLVDAAEQSRCAVIPGLFLGKEVEDSHAFIQVLDGTSGSVAYYRFPPEEFEAARDRFEVRIGKNIFTSEGITLDLTDEEGAIQGDVRFSGTIPWPVTFAAPGIMGWYAWVPMMECYHGVVSLDHVIEGALEIDGRTIDFTGGRGYTEKDWGRSFPSSWIWLQSNLRSFGLCFRIVCAWTSKPNRQGTVIRGHSSRR